jgi:Spy/CpxP family protein refolding chaperone
MRTDRSFIMQETKRHAPRPTLIAAAAALLLFVPLLAAAQSDWDGGYPPYRHGPRGGHLHGMHGHHGPAGFEGGFFLGRLVERLDLTEEQRAEVHALMEEHHESFQDEIEQLHTARLALMEQSTASEFDEMAIRAAAEEVATIEVELQVARAQLLQQVLQLLTPEQQEEARRMLDAHRERLQIRMQERKEGVQSSEGDDSGQLDRRPRRR